MKKYKLDFPEEMQGLTDYEKRMRVSDYADFYSNLRTPKDEDGNWFCIVVEGGLNCPFATYIGEVEDGDTN